MINAKTIAYQVRRKLGDLNEVTYSDYDVLDALNEALRYLCMHNSLQNTDYLDAVEVYEADDYEDTSFATDGVSLPTDFQVLTKVCLLNDIPLHPCDITFTPDPMHYKVMGGKIYAGVDAFKLYYKKVLSEVTSLSTGTIALPLFCKDILIQLTQLILAKTASDVMFNYIDTVTKQLIPRRKYANAEVRMPFYC